MIVKFEKLKKLDDNHNTLYISMIIGSGKNEYKVGDLLEIKETLENHELLGIIEHVKIKKVLK